MPSDEAQYKLMQLLDANPGLSQRDLAKELRVSVGKVNYCLKALMDRGFVKTRNFCKSGRKLAYAYKLTPSGLQEKSRAAVRFLSRKVREYEELKKEIELLKREAGLDG